MKRFTLIEMLVVIGIICILASLSVPVMGVLMKSRSMDNAEAMVRSTLGKARLFAATGRKVEVKFDTQYGRIETIDLRFGKPVRKEFLPRYAQFSMLPLGNSLIFFAGGMLDQESVGSSMALIGICDRQSKEEWIITVLSTGLIEE